MNDNKINDNKENDNKENDEFLNSLSINTIIEYIDLFEKIEQLYSSDIKIIKNKSINILKQKIDNISDNLLSSCNNLKLEKIFINGVNGYLTSDIGNQIIKYLNINIHANNISNIIEIDFLMKQIINIFNNIIKQLHDNEKSYNTTTYIVISNEFSLVEKFIHDKIYNYGNQNNYSTIINEINSLVSTFNENNNNKLKEIIVSEVNKIVHSNDYDKSFEIDLIIYTLEDYFNCLKKWFINKKIYDDLVEKIHNYIIIQNLLNNDTDKKKLKQFIQSVIDDN